MFFSPQGSIVIVKLNDGKNLVEYLSLPQASVYLGIM